MRLKIIGGTLEVEITKGMLDIDDVRELLKNAVKKEDEKKKKKIRMAGESQSKWMGKLGEKPKIPI